MSASSSPQVSSSSDITTERLIALLTGLVQALVDQPNAVSVSADSGANSTALRLEVAPDDLGKVIGKQGRDSAFPSHYPERHRQQNPAPHFAGRAGRR